MLVFSPTTGGIQHLADQSQLNDPHALNQSLSATSADESMQQESQPAAQELESGAVTVHEDDAMVAEQTVTAVEEAPRTRKRRRVSSQPSTAGTEEHDPKKSAGAGRVAYIDSL
jgi:protein involved in polysaccharide export with SLBB domain